MTFTDLGRSLDGCADSVEPDEAVQPIGHGLQVEEAKLGCVTAMLMCLLRLRLRRARQRNTRAQGDLTRRQITQLVGRATAAGLSCGQDAGFQQQLDITQGGIERTTGQLGVAGGGKLRVAAVEQGIDDEPLSFIYGHVVADPFPCG